MQGLFNKEICVKKNIPDEVHNGFTETQTHIIKERVFFSFFSAARYKE